jgi:hypothetical protein
MAPSDRIRYLEMEENLERVEIIRSEEERELSDIHLQCGTDVIGNDKSRSLKVTRHTSNQLAHAAITN